MPEQIILTPVGIEKIKEEIRELKTVRRKKVAERIEAALKLGDLSENAEYHDAKEESGWIEGRIMELEHMLSQGVVLNHKNSDVITMGSVITVEAKGKQKKITLVGDNETDPGQGKISTHAPLGAALMGRRINENVTVPTPAGPMDYTIVSIS